MSRRVEKKQLDMSKSVSLLIATGNRGKLKEFNDILSTLPIRLLNLTDFPHIASVTEDGKTFVPAVAPELATENTPGCAAPLAAVPFSSP